MSNTRIKEFIKHELSTNDKWASEALITIYKFQTKDEQVTKTTSRLNSIGFTAMDAEFLTSLAQFKLERGYLSPKQLIFVKKRISKYWKQILNVCDKDKLANAIVNGADIAAFNNTKLQPVWK